MFRKILGVNIRLVKSNRKDTNLTPKNSELDERKEQLMQVLQPNDTKTIPRYLVPGVAKTKTIQMMNNLQSIIRQGGLLSHVRIRQDALTYKDVANQDVQSRRERTKIPVGAGGYLHDYVPFYFAPRSPMLYVLRMQQISQDNIVYLMTNTVTIQQQCPAFVFTDAHAIRRLTNFYKDLEDLSQVDWDICEHRYGQIQMMIRIGKQEDKLNFWYTTKFHWLLV